MRRERRRWRRSARSSRSTAVATPGPVGWIDGSGDGEWAIALRSAEVEGPDRVRAYAGAGVVAASDAHQELEETGWKFQPIQEALAAVTAPR